MLGTGTRMEAVTTDWGARGYMHLAMCSMQVRAVVSCMACGHHHNVATCMPACYRRPNFRDSGMLHISHPLRLGSVWCSLARWDPAVEDPKLVYDGFGHATTVPCYFGFCSLCTSGVCWLVSYCN